MGDVPALLVFVSGFVVCAGVVFLISIFGAKEETFEEALAKQRKANEKEKKSKDKKKDENSGKKSKNWRMKKKGERDDKQDGLDDAEEEPMVVVPTGAKIEDVVEAVPEKVVEPVPVPSVEVKQPKKEKNKKKTTIEIQEVETIPEPKEVVAPPVEAAPVVEKE